MPFCLCLVFISIDKFDILTSGVRRRGILELISRTKRLPARFRLSIIFYVSIERQELYQC